MKMFIFKPWLGAPLTAVVLLLSADRAFAESGIGHSARDSGSDTSWTDFTCLDKHNTESDFFYPNETWKALKLDDAWRDVVRNFKDIGQRSGLTFTESLFQTLKLPLMPGCSNFGKLHNCMGTISCSSTFGGSNSSGLAATKLWNALTLIGETHVDYFTSFRSVLPLATTHLETFARISPEPSTWLPLLVDVVTIGAAFMIGPSTKTFLGKQSYFLRDGPTLHNINDTALALIGQAPTIALEIMTNTDKYDWTPAEGITFEDYFRRQTLDAWSNMTSVMLQTLFNGDDASIEGLGSIIRDGQLTYGRVDRAPDSDSAYETDRVEEAGWDKAYFGLMIPAVWRLSGTYAFIMDSGAPCDSTQSLKKYLDDGTRNATEICYEDKQYFLVEPAGSVTKGTFSAPMGLDKLDEGHWNGITRETIITGSLRTYAANGNHNGGMIDLKDRDILLGLIHTDLTTPGVMKLPVCIPEEALQSWRGRKRKSNPYYPCAIPDKKK